MQTHPVSGSGYVPGNQTAPKSRKIQNIYLPQTARRVLRKERTTPQNAIVDAPTVFPKDIQLQDASRKNAFSTKRCRDRGIDWCGCVQAAQ